MSEQKRTRQKKTPQTASAPSVPMEKAVPMEKIAAQYLDLWQDNLRYWATDPDALDKWVMEAARHIKSSDENIS